MPADSGEAGVGASIGTDLRTVADEAILIAEKCGVFQALVLTPTAQPV